MSSEAGISLDALEHGEVCAGRVIKSGTTKILRTAYVVNAPVDMAWASGHTMADRWQYDSKLFTDIKKTMASATERKYIVTWADGTQQEVKARFDDTSHQIHFDFCSVNGSGMMVSTDIRMRPYLDGKTLVQAEMAANYNFAKHLGDLVFKPLDWIAPHNPNARLIAFWQHVAEDHRKAALTAARSTTPSNRVHVFSVGINTPPNHPEFSETDFAESDAKAFAEWAKQNYKETPKITEVLGDAVTSPNIGRLLAQIGDREIVRPGDTVYFYYAGHIVLERPKYTDDDSQVAFIQTSNSEKNNRSFTSVKRDDIIDALEHSAAGTCIAVFDACFSGGDRKSSYSTSRIATRGSPLSSTAPLGHTAIFSAADQMQLAIESPDLSHGLFTYYWILGANGNADRDHDNCLGLDELRDWIKEQVSIASQNRQVPYVQLPQSKSSTAIYPLGRPTCP